jgi:hypothetical protein
VNCAKARMMLYAQSDDEGRLMVGLEKMNTAAPIPASTFTIHSVQHFEPTANSDGTVPLLVCAGESESTAREHIAATVEPVEDEPGGQSSKSVRLRLPAHAGRRGQRRERA